MSEFKPRWEKIAEDESLRRSSQVVSTVGNQVIIFGGEQKPRQPVDNDVYTIKLGDKGISVQALPSDEASPSARVGTAAATLENSVYIFSGRGGEAMAPIDEKGALWKFDTITSKWSHIAPLDVQAPFPQARSYHCLTSDGVDKIYLHAGCPEKGRLSDLWYFNVKARSWTRLAFAPDPPRGGTSIAYAQGKLYRMNGFDGSKELGGSLDIYSPESDSWSTLEFPADNASGPGPRSVGALLHLEVQSKASLVTLFGECDPSALGHQGAGKMLSDIWVFDLEQQRWTQAFPDPDVGQTTPEARGWFAASVVAQTQHNQQSIVLHGGLGESNDRLSDAWLLHF
ncbi:kelch repeat protein [Saccharata proteae CBS 121410]|uniref:Kelch repeat protein n=1 Tax=Saccharata proteae CBS 121410 TaxID=1314787 RepID=A0A9P4HXS0_9PEZI|nr:kelch repeat protein [Saccharata proteae CBS 121410]